MTRKAHKTPAWLDKQFERRKISIADYHDFWSNFWSFKSRSQREQYIDDYTRFYDTETGDFQPKEEVKGRIFTSKKEAKQALKEYKLLKPKAKSYVQRRNKFGRFSRSGHKWTITVRKH